MRRSATSSQTGDDEHLVDPERVGYSDATIVISSRTERSRIKRARLQHDADGTGLDGVTGDMPNSSTWPRSGRVSPSIMSIVVDLPAPFGPSRATVSPGATERSTPWTACTAP